MSAPGQGGAPGQMQQTQVQPTSLADQKQQMGTKKEDQTKQKVVKVQVLAQDNKQGDKNAQGAVIKKKKEVSINKKKKK